MRPSPRQTLLHVPLALATLGLVSLLAINGCGDDNNDNPTNPGGGATSTSFTGTFMSGYEGGMLTVTINTVSLARSLRAASAAVTATGVISPDGGTAVDLVGTYDATTDSLYLTGGSYALAGKYDASGSIAGIGGAYVGPAAHPGVFGCAIGGTSSISVYCGTFQNQANTLSGRWNLVFSGNQVAGIALPNGDNAPEPPLLEGTVTGTGTSRPVTLGYNDGSGFVISALGTLDTAAHTVSGSWHTTQDAAPVDSGTWSGDPCATAIP